MPSSDIADRAEAFLGGRQEVYRQALCVAVAGHLPEFCDKLG